MNMIEYGDKSFDGIIGEVEKIFGDKKHGLHLGTEIQRIGEILSQQDDIENSYVMGNNWVFVYYCNCKLLFADFIEGDEITATNIGHPYFFKIYCNPASMMGLSNLTL